MTTFEGQHFAKNTTPLFTMFPSVQVSGKPRPPMAFSYTAHKQQTSGGGGANSGDADSFWSQTKQVRQWSETRNHNATPGVVMTTRTASVSQWMEYSSGGQKTEVTHETSQSQFQTFISPPSTTSSSTAPILALTDKDYLDNLQLETEPLDLAAQIGKSCIGRKGSLGGRRPPTIRARRTSQGSHSVQQNESIHLTAGLANGAQVANGRLVSSSQIESPKSSGSRSNGDQLCSVPRLGTASLLTGLTVSTSSSAASTVSPVLHSPVVSTKSTVTKTPPPRPPPPVFRSADRPAAAHTPLVSETRVLLELQLADAQLRANNQLKQLLTTPDPAEKKSVSSLRDWSNRSVSSVCSTPPSLPATSPPPLPGPDDGVMDFILQSSTPKAVSPDFTDVVDIRDKESVEDGQIVRRRTIITLGPKVNSGSQPSSLVFNSDAEFGHQSDFARPCELKVSSGSINVTVKSTQSDCGPKREGVSTMFVRASDADKRGVSRVSAFNVRRTIEQRRNAAQQQAPKVSRASAEDINSSTNSVNNKSGTRTPSPVSSTYLYGDDNDALSAASSDLSVARTMSISMSFDDLDSNSEAGGSQGPARIKKNEAWYERRQSYGFEAADKLQSLLNTSNGSSETRDLSSSSTRISRSCDSLGSTVKSTSSNIEKMIPPWIKMSPSSASNDDYFDRDSRANENRSRASSRFSYLFGENPSTDSLAAVQPQDKIPAAASAAPDVPTPTPVATATPAGHLGPVRRSESAKDKEKTRSATNLLDQKAKESEPVWLRDLKIRRSLREQRSPRFTPREEESIKSSDPPWINVKLRRTGVKLVDEDAEQPPTPKTADRLSDNRLSASSSREDLLQSPGSGAESTNQSRIPKLFISRSSTFSSRDSVSNTVPAVDSRAPSDVKPKRAEPKLFQRASWNSRDTQQFASPQLNDLKTQRLFNRASWNNSRDSLHSLGAEAKEGDFAKKTSARSSRESLTSLVSSAAESPRVPVLNLTESKAQKLINKSALNSRESLLSVGAESASAALKVAEMYCATVETSSQSKMQNFTSKSSVNSCESLDKIPSDAAPVEAATGQRPSQPVDDKPLTLLHTKSIELMKMLDDTRLLSQSVAKSAAQQQDGRHSEGAADVATSQTDSAPLATPTVTTLFISEIRASDSLNDVTEYQSGASVKNSIEDLTQLGRRTKKVVFDKDTKEESDRVSRPRRIRSRSPETRLREWQSKLETRVGHSDTSPESVASATGLPLTRFGDLEPEIPSATATTVTRDTEIRTESVSETFRSLLQPRKSFAFNESSESSRSSESYSRRIFAAEENEEQLEEIVSTGVTTIPVRAPNIVNGIVNFDYSVERKIVILETERAPPPKSILKKRSLENLLDDRASVRDETASVTSTTTIVNPVPLNASASPNAPIPTAVMTSTVKLGDDFTLPAGGGILINGKPSTSRLNAAPELTAPWKVHLKRVEPPLKSKSSDDELNEERPAPWKAEFIRKRASIPSGGIRETSRSTTPENFLDQRPEESSHLTPPAAEEPVKKISDHVVSRIPVVMVARCELKHSHSFRQTAVGVSSGSTSLVTSLPVTEEQAKCDLGYHSLETDPTHLNRIESNNNISHTNKINNNNSSASSSRSESSETKSMHKTIDEVIEKLNETIEEIRSVEQVIRTSDPLTEEAPVVQASSQPPQSPVPPPTLPAHLDPLKISQTPTDQSDGSQQLDDDPPQAARKMPATREDTKLPDSRPISDKSDAPPPVPPPPKDTDQLMRAPQGKDNRTSVSITKMDGDIHQQRSVSSQQTQVQRHSLSSVTGIRVAIPVRPISPTLAEPEASVEDILRKFEGLRTKTVKTVDTKWNTPAPPIVPARFSSRNAVEKSSVQRSTETRQTRTTTRTEKVVTTKEEKKIQLTSGMAEEKAALLVRKFFNNSVIDTCKARMAKTDTIPEETSGTEPNSPSSPSPVIASDQRSKSSGDRDAFFPLTTDDPSDLPSETGASDVSFDAEELFRPSSGAELDSDFGSALDLLDAILDTMTDDDMQSIRTESSKTLTTSRRDSTSESVTDSEISTSDTSFKFSDFLRGSSASQSASSFNQIDSSPPSSPPPPRDSEQENVPIVPPKRTKVRTGLKMPLTPTSSSASGSVRSVPKPTQISSHLRVKAAITATCIDRPTKTSAMKDVRNIGAQSEGSLIHKSSTAAAKTSATKTDSKSSGSSRERTSSGAAPAVKPQRSPSKSTPSVDPTAVADSKVTTKSPPDGSSRTVKSTRSIRAAHSNPTTESKGLTHSSSRTPTRSSTTRSRTSSAKEDVNNRKPSKSASPKTTSHERRTSSSAVLRANRLVTITPYSSKGTADEAVIGIRETPIVVSSGHYKIRMDQRIPSSPIKTSASASPLTKTHSSHRTTVTTTTTERRLALTKK